MQKWEYAVVPVTNHPDKRVRHEGKDYKSYEYMDFYGEKGWELVSVSPDMYLRHHILYFKRPKRETPK